MSRHIIISLVSILSFITKAGCQNFQALTSQIFFNAEIHRHDTTILSYFKAIPGLKLEKQTGYTFYSPTDSKQNPIPFKMFLFTKHPYFSSLAGQGELVVLPCTNSDSLIGMTISMSFNSYKAFDSTYKKLKKLYKRYSIKVEKRKNIAEPHEETKYRSKDNEFVIVAKGVSDNKPYIYIAYDYQAFDW